MVARFFPYCLLFSEMTYALSFLRVYDISALERGGGGGKCPPDCKPPSGNVSHSTPREKKEPSLEDETLSCVL